MENPIHMLAMASTIAFVVYMLFASLFGDHHGADASSSDVGDGFSVLQFLSIQSVLLAVMSYSWSWLFWSQGDLGMAGAAIATVFSGSAMVAFYVLGVHALKKLNTRDHIEAFVPEVGMHATVYTTIPPGGTGYGLITILCPNRGDFEFNATTLGKDPIATGTKVVLAELNLPSNVIVRLA